MKVELIDSMGDDLRVVNAARVSFDKESSLIQRPYDDGVLLDEELPAEYEPYEQDWPLQFDDQMRELSGFMLSKADTRLIRYLAKHGHWTPFAHPTITLRETVPIFVARQRFKHMVGFTYNEVSRRYVDDAPELYMPEVWRKRPEGSVKQGSSHEAVELLSEPMISICSYTEEMLEFTTIDEAVRDLYESAMDTYETLIASGVCPEQARMVLPQSMMTSYYVTGSLAAFARAYVQRSDAHAQLEIQMLAKEWDKVIRPLFPVSWAALVDKDSI